MKTMIYLRAIMLLFFITNCVEVINAQNENNCSFQIDKNAISTNKNLTQFIEEFKKDTFYTTNNKKDIPKKTMKLLRCYSDNFKLANPNQDWNGGCTTSSYSKPHRILTLLTKSKNFLVMRYLTGGLGVTSNLVIIKYLNNEINDIWIGTCDPDVKNINEVIDYIQANLGNKDVLNTKYIYF